MNMKPALHILSSATLCAAAISAGISLSGCSGTKAPSQQTAQQLEEGFITPPNEAKPRVWWHWMNANVTDEGIKADLEWMDRVGIGGFHNFDANCDMAQIVKERLVYMSDPWKQSYRKMIRMADSLGMEMGIAASAGWSETGGPWVKPEQAMKKVVWSETDVQGGNIFKGTLPEPASVTVKLPGSGENQHLYKDIAVLAFRLPWEDKNLNELSPKLTTSGSQLTFADLTDGNFGAEKSLHFGKDGAWIQYEFAEPTTVSTVTEASSDYSTSDLEVSNDGASFTEVLEMNQTAGSSIYTFAPVTGKYFRLHFDPQPGFDKIDVAEFSLGTAPRIMRAAEKAGFGTNENLSLVLTPDLDKSLCIDGDKIVDLTSKMAEDGSLEWTPEGDGTWRIIRFGYALTGKMNAPATPEATGLEVDKFEPEYVREYLNTYLDMYKDATDGMIGSKGIQYIMLDSWEAGSQNWTDRMMEYFKNYRGYDMLRFLPAIAGYIVDDSETSEKFLWDFRKTIAHLIAENHYGTIDEVLSARGLKRYTESHECGRAFVGDGIEIKKNADIPMSATWVRTDGKPAPNDMHHEADNRESASVAHIYGQKFVACESMTDWGMGSTPGHCWGWSPETLKPTADLEFATGVNRFVIHSTVHQPDNEHVPGLALGPFGQWFNRHETWAEQAGPWVTYIARTSFMLQQGKAAEDILYFYGEDSDMTALFHYAQPDMPKGYSYDFVNPDALETVIDVRNGKIMTPAGTEYSVLVLDKNASRMTVKTLKAIGNLVNKGMTVIGDKPSMSPTLADDEAEFEALASKLWAGSETGAKVGKGAIWSGKDIASVLEACGDKPDCIFTGASEGADMRFVHRIADGIHIYWLDSRSFDAEDVKVSFKVNGLKPEIWDPVSGKIADVSYTTEGENTVVPMHFDAFDTYFIVFREKAAAKSAEIPSRTCSKIADISSAWSVTFDGLGCHKTVDFPTLSAWNESEDSEIKYYSGSAVYANKISVSEEDLQNGEIWLSLGEVKNIAEVTVNGQYVGEIWRAPFRIDISGFLKAGENDLEVKVTNLWVNRLIGDEQPGVKKLAYISYAFHEADEPLLPSGLIGPVSLEAEK